MSSPDAPAGGAPDGAPSSRHGGRERVFLTLFFCLHFGAVGVYVAPGDAESLSGLPEAVREPVASVVPPLVRRAWPVAEPYLNLTATRQHWYLFSPSPAEWAASLDVVAYFPPGPEDDAPPAAGDGDSLVVGADGTLWDPDTLRVYGPREDPLPHWWSHRRFRLVFNMGYEGWGEFYRPFFARATCRRLAEARGRPPGGIELFAIWERIRIPWLEGSGGEIHRQDLGGFTCPGSEEGSPGLDAGGSTTDAPSGGRGR